MNAACRNISCIFVFVNFYERTDYILDIKYKDRIIGTYRDSRNNISEYMLWNELTGIINHHDKDTLAKHIGAGLVSLRNARFKHDSLVCLDCDVDDLPKYSDTTMAPLDNRPSFILVATRGDTVYLLHSHSFKLICSTMNGVRDMIYGKSTNIVNVKLNVNARKIEFNRAVVPEI